MLVIFLLLDKEETDLSSHLAPQSLESLQEQQNIIAAFPA